MQMNRMHEFPSRVTSTDSRSFRVLLEKTKVSDRNRTRERERERKESFIKYSSTGTANRSPNFFHRIPSNHCKTSSKLLCPNTVHIISHRSMLISSKETKRNSRFFEFIFHCRSILKKHLLIHWNISTYIARRSENSINFHQVFTYRQSPLSLTLTLPPKLSRRWQEARV